MLNIEGFLGKFAYRTRDGDRFQLCMLWEERNGPEHILPLHAPTQKRGYDGQTKATGFVLFVTG
jgi:hypothetical protein